MCILWVFTLWFEWKLHILALRRMQKSVQCVRSMGNIQNGYLLIFTFFAYKQYTRRFIKFRLNHWWQMDFPGDAFYSLQNLDGIYLEVDGTVTSLPVFI